jgi:glycosyltransferase involved in cell wall biosynthesis
MKVAALTQGRDVPSSRFRVRQHLALLARLGIEVREHLPPFETMATRLNARGPAARLVRKGLDLVGRLPGVAATFAAQATWLQRPLFPGHLGFEPALHRPVVFDVDDAIWRFGRRGEQTVAAIARRARVVVAGNEYLADWFRPHAREVQVVPTAIDVERFRPLQASRREGFVIGWTGSATNLPYLHAIEDGLREVLEAIPDARLLVVSDAAPRFVRLSASRIEFHRWTPAVEAEMVARMDVGLMPLPDDPWTRGKCSFKLLQYMACAVPFVASPVGMNREVLAAGEVGFAASSADEFAGALRRLHEDRALAARLGVEGRRVAEEKFSLPRIAARLAEIFLRLGR